MTFTYNNYAKEITEGKIISCKYMKLACKRYLDELKKQEDDSFPFYFDDKSAQKPIEFAYKFLRFYDDRWNGKPIEFLPWQQFSYANLYGWKKKTDKTRRFKRGFIEVGRESGKSIMMDVGAIYDILFTNGAQTCLVSNSGKQAKELYGKVEKIIGSNEHIRSELTIMKSAIVNEKQAGSLQFFSTDATRLDGWHASFAIIDELSAHKNERVINTIWSGMGSKSNSLMISITTAGFDLDSPGYSEYLFAKKVLNNQIDIPDYFAMIYELDDDDDLEDETNYIKANPSLGETITLDTFINMRNIAFENDTDKQEFLTKRLNKWLFSKPNTWISDTQFLRSFATTMLTEEEKKSKGCLVSGGVDLSKRTDWSVFTLCFYKDGKYYNTHTCYIPEATIKEKYGTDSSLIYQWIEEKKLKSIPGDIILLDSIYQDIDEAIEKYGLKYIGVDRNYGGTDLIEHYQSKIMPVPISLATADRTPILIDWHNDFCLGNIVEENYREGKTIMRYMIGNCGKNDYPNGNIQLVKVAGYASSNQRIDAIQTATYAYQVMKGLILEEKANPASKKALKNFFDIKLGS